MTPYEYRRAWALDHPDRVRASKREHMRRLRERLRAINPNHRQDEYELTKFKRATQETHP